MDRCYATKRIISLASWSTNMQYLWRLYSSCNFPIRVYTFCHISFSLLSSCTIILFTSCISGRGQRIGAMCASVHLCALSCPNRLTYVLGDRVSYDTRSPMVIRRGRCVNTQAFSFLIRLIKTSQGKIHACHFGINFTTKNILMIIFNGQKEKVCIFCMFWLWRLKWENVIAQFCASAIHKWFGG